MDGVSDFDFFVASSKRYKYVAKTVYVEGAYANLAETDLVKSLFFLSLLVEESNHIRKRKAA